MTIESVIQRVRNYHPGADVNLLRRAFEFASEVHKPHKRLSGEPYINHPLETAAILAELEMDEKSIAAALLHDVIEDGHVEFEELERVFDKEIATLVDGVTKLKLADFEPRDADAEDRKKRQSEVNRSAENLRKIFLAMARDFRVMVIKLADRLHNMRTLSALPRERQIKVASETIQIYAPLSHRLGIWQIKWQLEDLAFKYTQPREYEEIVEKVSRTRRQREKSLKEVVDLLRAQLEADGIKAEIQGRPKHLYSIYQKMLRQEVDFDEIYDLTAIRIIVDTVGECYHALGVVHEKWMPIPARFGDYIGNPKSNMYQSLHTKVIGPNSEPIEIQIRTWEMHRTAEFGIAAHWQYKEGKGSDDRFSGKLAWLRQQLFDWQADSKDATEFLRAVTDDLFSDQVFVFTPRGDVIDLPMGSTPVDFAYRIHSDVGNQCVGAKVNGRIVPLSYQLNNGDILDIITRANTAPSLDWLTFVKTGHARSKVKQHFRKLRYNDSVAKGREMLEKEMERQGLDSQELLKPDSLQPLLDHFSVQAEDDLFAAIGYGHIAAMTVINRMKASQPMPDELVISGKRPSSEAKLGIVAGGVDGIAIRRSKCCTPIPGDEVMGYVTRGRGMTLHRRGCPNLTAYAEREPDRLIEVEWTHADGERFRTGMYIEAMDRVGLLNDISAIFSESKTNICSAKIKSFSNKTASFSLVVEVDDLAHLNSIITTVGNLSDILEIRRANVSDEEGTRSCAL